MQMKLHICEFSVYVNESLADVQMKAISLVLSVHTSLFDFHSRVLSTISEPIVSQCLLMLAGLLKVLLSRSWLVHVAEGAVVCAVGTVGTVPGVVAVNPR